MVGFYSSYLEFIGAVYFSMSLDEILKKKIWSPQDEIKQKKLLESLGGYEDKNFAKAVVDANQAKGIILQAELIKKSVIGLFLIAFLLVLCGFESNFKDSNNESTLLNFHLCVAYTIAYFLLSLFVLQWIVFNKWKYIVLYLISVLLVFLLLFCFDYTYGNTQIEFFIVKHIGLYVCVAVSIPILWQIFITWIYKSVFYGYIKDKIINSRNKYQKVINDIQNGNYNSLPKEYHEIYMKNSQKTPDTTAQKAMDDSLTEYRGVLYNEIRTIGNKVKLFDLVFAWTRYKITSLWNWISNIFKSRGKSLVCKKTLRLKDYSFYAKQYQIDKNKDKSLKMRTFCRDKNIDFEEFNKYYCKYCQCK